MKQMTTEEREALEDLAKEVQSPDTALVLAYLIRIAMTLEDQPCLSDQP